MMLHLAMNFNKIALSWLHARVKESTTRVRRQEDAHSAPYKKEWVGGRAGLRQGPSSLNPAGVNGLIPAKKKQHVQGASPGAPRLSRGGVRNMTCSHAHMLILIPITCASWLKTGFEVFRQKLP